MDIVISLMRIIVEQTTTARLDSTTVIPIANSNSTYVDQKREKKRGKIRTKKQNNPKDAGDCGANCFLCFAFPFHFVAFVQKCHLLIKSPKREGEPLPK